MTHGLNRDRLIAVLMLLPSLALLAVFVYIFIGATAYTSMTDSNALQRLSNVPATFVGLDNYNDLFAGPLDTRFRVGIVNTVFFTILFIVFCLGLGMLLAILLDQKVKGEGFFRTIFLFPMSLSFVVTGVIWKWLFNPTAGINVLPTFIGLPPAEFRWFISQERILEFNWQDLPVIISIIVIAVLLSLTLWWAIKRNRTFTLIGGAAVLLISTWVLLGGAASLNALPRPETHGFNLALIAIVVSAGWQMVGYTMAMYLAGLRGISEELREAGRVDGCTEFGVYRHIVFPLLAPITLSAIIILGHISLKIFDLVYVMGGGDLLVIDMPGINMFFETFRGQNFGRGAAIAIVMLILVAAVIVPYLANNMRGENKQ